MRSRPSRASCSSTSPSGRSTAASETVTGNLSVGGTTAHAGAVTINNTLNVQSAATFQSTVQTGALSAASAAVSANTTVGGTLTVTGALRTFDLVWLTTRGGPGTSTITPSFLLYTKAFSVGDVGAAAAIGVVMALTCLLVALLIVRLVERDA